MGRAFIVISFLLFAASAGASDCREYALLHDAEYFAREYRWAKGRMQINLWDSPAQIMVIGKAPPGLQMLILDEKGKFYKVRLPDVLGGVAGWVKKEFIEKVFPKDPEAADCG